MCGGGGVYTARIVSINMKPNRKVVNCLTDCSLAERSNDPHLFNSKRNERGGK